MIVDNNIHENGVVGDVLVDQMTRSTPWAGADRCGDVCYSKSRNDDPWHVTYFINRRGHILPADVQLGPSSNEVIRRLSSPGATSINLEYLMHANE